MMLALVPTSDVPDVFNQLVENIPDTVQIDPLHGYFESTRIAGLNGRAARYHIPFCFLEPDGHSRDQPEQDKQLR